jgi:tRNA(fMet)-specific endonuclease VapC
MRYYLDTNICIYYLKGKFPRIVEKLLSKHPDDIKIPSIVKAELFYGAEKSQQKDQNLQKIREFLLPFEVKSFGDPESEIYGKIRSELEKSGRVIGPNDLLIAATVIANNGVLITNNEREFERISEIDFENWTL